MTKEFLHPEWTVGNLWDYFLNECGRAQSTMGSATPGKEVAGTKESIEKALEFKEVSRIPPQSLLQFLPTDIALSAFLDFP